MTSSVPGGYRPEAGRYDELLDDSGAVRPSWQPVVDAWWRLDGDEIVRRARSAQRHLRAETAGFMFDDDAAGPATLDALPYIVPGDEWTAIAAGVRQRAELLELVLADLYGPRRLLTEGVIPPGAALAARALQFAAVGVAVDRPRLVSYAADLIRRADGQMLVVRDHTDVPAGAGHALWHRSVLAAMLPDVQATLRVQPLDGWLPRWRSVLAGLAPAEVDSPRTVVLGPPPDHPDFVESSYLASNLGYHLAGSDDLVMRSGRVWLRALEGMEQVDVVLRRIADHTADPLELVPVSAGGVAGLLQAAREGSVVVANSLGSAATDRLWLQPFLAAVCERLLGEPLRLPQIDTLWCGDPDHRRAVLGDFDRFVLHDIDPIDPLPSVFADALTAEDGDLWHARIAAAPGRFVAQRKEVFATVPVADIEGDGPVITSGLATIRAQAVRSGASFAVLPGGYARVLDPHRPLIEPGPCAGKDVWVTGDSGRRSRPADSGVVLPQIDLRDSLPTRSAESLYWLGRNAERAEFVARVARLVIGRAERDAALCETPWLTTVLFGLDVVATAAPAGLGPDLGADRPVDERLDRALAGALGNRPGGLADGLGHVISGAASVREFLSTASFRVVNSLAHERGELGTAVAKADSFLIAEVLDRTIVALAALSGLAMESLVRGPGWRFGDLGRRLDRALLTARLIEATLRVDADPEEHEAVHAHLLAACESLVAYRRMFRTDLRLGSIRELLVNDPTNPRSIAFQLDRMAEHLDALPERDGMDAHRSALAAIGIQVSSIAGDSAAAIAEAVAVVAAGLERLSFGLVSTWFTQPPPLQLHPRGT